MTQNNWGVIYSPRKGIAKSHKRWRKICSYMKEQGISFDYVQSEGKGSVERLASMMTENGYATIIVVGGDGALNEALNGILSVDLPAAQRPALGIIPNGLGNDFARYWGFSEKDFKQTIYWLMCRRIRRIDVGILSYKDGGKSAKRYFLNCVNIGIVSSIMNLRYRMRNLFGIQTLAYLVSTFVLLFQRMVYKVDFELNAEHVKQKAMNLCIGSARGYGMTPSAVPYNGQLDVSLVSHLEISGLFHGLWLLFTGRFLSHKNVSAWRTTHLKINSFGKARVGVDGKVLHGDKGEMDIDIALEALDFIIPE